jgi:hypothetical protein
MRNYYVAVNAYRSSTDNGFANTWRVWRAESQAAQRRILRDGLPVADSVYLHDDGRRSPVCSTMGVRPARRDEIRRAARRGEPLPLIN